MRAPPAPVSPSHVGSSRHAGSDHLNDMSRHDCLNAVSMCRGTEDAPRNLAGTCLAWQIRHGKTPCRIVPDGLHLIDATIWCQASRTPPDAVLLIRAHNYKEKAGNHVTT